MAIAGLPFQHSVAGCTGAAPEAAIALPGIGETNNILAVIAYDPAGGLGVQGLDPADFAVSEGGDEITAATADTTGLSLIVVWSDNPAPDVES